jgi:NAD(P)-dependent dehydrogenase (short-subunit alcohol dehydrogenase family)
MRYGIPAMLASDGGSIINTASVVGQVAVPNQGAYGAAKMGIIGLTRTAAVEYGSSGIRVNALCPGFTNTPRMERQDPALLEMGKAQIVLGRFAESSEMASVALFLATEESSYITGLAIPVDGGYTAICEHTWRRCGPPAKRHRGTARPGAPERCATRRGERPRRTAAGP